MSYIDGVEIIGLHFYEVPKVGRCAVCVGSSGIWFHHPILSKKIYENVRPNCKVNINKMIDTILLEQEKSKKISFYDFPLDEQMKIREELFNNNILKCGDVQN